MDEIPWAMEIPIGISYIVNMYLTTLFGFPYNISGLKIGISEREYCISIGDVITVYGKAVYDRTKNQVHFTNPLYFLNDKSSIIKQMERKITGVKKCMSFVWIPIFAFSMGYILYHYKKSWDKH